MKAYNTLAILKISKECLPYIDKFVELENLDISKTAISLNDLSILSNLKKINVSSYELKK